MEGYSVKIAESSLDLTAKMRIALKDTTDCIKLDEIVGTEPLIVEPNGYAILEIHNEKSDNKDYRVFVLVAETGERYVTGSESFISSFMNIYEEMKEEEELWSIKVYKVDSKNYKGKKFLTCSII